MSKIYYMDRFRNNALPDVRSPTPEELEVTKTYIEDEDIFITNRDTFDVRVVSCSLIENILDGNVAIDDIPDRDNLIKDIIAEWFVE